MKAIWLHSLLTEPNYMIYLVHSFRFQIEKNSVQTFMPDNIKDKVAQSHIQLR